MLQTAGPGPMLKRSGPGRARGWPLGSGQRLVDRGSQAQGVQAPGPTRQCRTTGGLPPPVLMVRLLVRTQYTRGARAGITRVRVRGWGSVTPADFVRGSAIRCGGSRDHRQVFPVRCQSNCIDDAAVHRDLRPGGRRHENALYPQRMRAADSDPSSAFGGPATVSARDVGPWLCVAAFRRVCLCRSAYEIVFMSRNRMGWPDLLG